MCNRSLVLKCNTSDYVKFREDCYSLNLFDVEFLVISEKKNNRDVTQTQQTVAKY